MIATANSLFLLASFLLYQALQQQWGMTVVLLAAAFVVSAAGKFVQVKARSRLTVWRDARARMLQERLSRGEVVHGDIFLYLRPFMSTGKLGVSNPRGLAIATPESLAEDRIVELESVLRNSLDPWGSLVGLGRPGESEGAGRILTTEEDWRTMFRTLAGKAKLLIVLPSSRSGTLEEINYLACNGLLAKTIFIMPPLNTSDYDVAGEWAAAAVAMSRLGLRLPEYVPEGRFVAFRDGTGADRLAGQMADAATEARTDPSATQPPADKKAHEQYIVPIDLASKRRLAPGIVAAAAWLGVSLTRSPLSQQTRDTPLPMPLAFGLYFSLSLLATTYHPFASTWGQALLGAAFGLLVSRYLPVDRFSFPMLTALVSVAFEELLGPFRSLGSDAPGLYLYVLTRTLAGAAMALCASLSLRSDGRQARRRLWVLAVLGYGLLPWTSTALGALLGWIQLQVLGWSWEVLADVHWVIRSLCAGAMSGWMVAKGMGPESTGPEADPGPLIGLGSVSTLTLVLLQLAASLTEWPRSRGVEVIIAFATVGAGCTVARYLYLQAVVGKARSMAIAVVWLAVGAIAFIAWWYLAPEAGTSLSTSYVEPPPPPPPGIDIAYPQAADFASFYLAWSALAIGAACGLATSAALASGALRGFRMAAAVAIAFQIATMLTLLSGPDPAVIALGWGACAWYCALWMERCYRPPEAAQRLGG